MQKIEKNTKKLSLIYYREIKQAFRDCQCTYVHASAGSRNTKNTPLSMTLKLNKVLDVVRAHVHAQFHHAKCSVSCVIVPKRFCLILQW